MGFFSFFVQWNTLYYTTKSKKSKERKISLNCSGEKCEISDLF